MDYRPLIKWQPGAVVVTITINDERHLRLSAVRPKNTQLPDELGNSALPLAEVRLSGEGREIDTSKRHINGYLSRRLQYVQHREHEMEGTSFLDVETRDPKTGLIVTSHFSVFGEVSVLRSSIEVQNPGNIAVVLDSVSSLVVGGVTCGSERYWDDYKLALSRNDWFRECQWQLLPLPSIGLDDFGLKSTRACFSLTNLGSFSTGGHLPLGALVRTDGRSTWLWQIEHNGSWRWEISDYRGSVYLNAGGPTGEQNWSKRLSAGESFCSVPVAIAMVNDDLESAFGSLTQYRRRLRRKHRDNELLPIIFNDYMNCLMGDPTAERISALIKPAASVGAEYFCIDCGWYADIGENWWPSVGLWEPSRSRFPLGLKQTFQEIRDAGMVPGLWIEPEVIGIDSPMASRLPKEAFFQRNGERVVEVSRYQLDYRHPAVIEWMNAVIDRLVNELGAGYFKFDYNIDITQGTDINSTTPGDGQLGHNRAYVKWVGQLFDRFPDLVIESCSSGGQRMDYALLAVHPIQSTSDQEDPVKYAAIAASAPTAVTPEQSASWAYPQASWSDELNALTVVNAILGRVHLSGKLDELSPKQLRLISDGMAVYKDIREEIRRAIPFWPLGLPQWSDDWVALGMDCGENKYISVWRRSGPRESCSFPIRGLIKETCKAECLYPLQMPGSVTWDACHGSLEGTIPAVPAARLYRVHSSGL